MEILLGIFLDFKKAFETVNHDILISKLSLYGIRGKALEWVKNYLSNRKQYVFHKEHQSSLSNIKCGVPQGSILGPLLFLLCINDIIHVSDIVFPMLYADDTNIFLSGKNVNVIFETMNHELKKFVQWLNVNKLSLNVDQTNFMIFNLRKNIYTRDVLINNKPIKR